MWDVLAYVAFVLVIIAFLRFVTRDLPRDDVPRTSAPPHPPVNDR